MGCGARVERAPPFRDARRLSGPRTGGLAAQGSGGLVGCGAGQGVGVLAGGGHEYSYRGGLHVGAGSGANGPARLAMRSIIVPAKRRETMIRVSPMGLRGL